MGEQEQKIEVPGATPQPQKEAQALEDQLQGGASAQDRDSETQGQSSHEAIDTKKKAEATKIEKSDEQEKDATKDKLIANIKAETDATKKLEELEKGIQSGMLTQAEADALQQEITQGPKENFLAGIGGKVLNTFGINTETNSGWRTATGIATLTAGAYAGYHLIKGVWNRWRGPSEQEKKEAAEKEKNKTLLERVWSKGLEMAKRGLIAGGVAGVGMYIMGLLTGGKGLGEILTDMTNTIKGFFGIGEKKEGSTGDEKPEVAGDPEGAIKDNRSEFLKLPEADQQIYNEWGENANTRGKKAGLSEDIFGGDIELSAIEKKPDGTEHTVDMTGLPAFILNAKHNTVDQILSERTIYREMMQSNDVVGFVGQLKGYLGDSTEWIKEKLKSVKNLFIPNDCFDAQGVIVEDKFVTYLKEHPDAEELLRNHIKKSLLTISCLNASERKYAYTLIATKCKKEDPTFATLSAEDQKEKIITLFADEEYMKTLEPDLEAFRQLPFFSAIKLLKETGSLNGDIDQVTQAGLDEVDDEKNDFLEIDPEDGDTVNCFSEIKNKLNQGEKLNDEEKELLIDKSDELLAMVQDFGETDWIMAHFGPIGDLLGRDRGAAKADILESMGYNTNVLNPIQTFITNFQKAVKEDTLTEENLNEFENAANDFFEYKKEIVLNTNEFADIKYNDDGSREITFGKLLQAVWATAKTVGGLVVGAVSHGGENMITGISMIGKGNIIEKIGGCMYFVEGSAVAGGGLMIGGKILQMSKYIVPKTGTLSIIPKIGDISMKIGKVAIKPATWLLEQGLRRSRMMSKIPYLNAGYYKNPDLLRADRARGRMTMDDVANIALKNKLISVMNPNDPNAVRRAFIQQYLVGKGGMNATELQRVDNLITQYPKSKSLQRALFGVDKKRWQFRSKNIGIKINTQFMEVAEHISKPNFSPHLFNNTLTKEQLLTRIAKVGKGFSMADIPTLSSHIHELQQAGKFDAIVLKNLLGNRNKIKGLTSAELVAQFDALRLGKSFKSEVLSLAKNAIGEVSIQAKNAAKGVVDLTNKLMKRSAKWPGAKQLLAKINSNPLLKNARSLDCLAFLGSAKRAEGLSPVIRTQLAQLENAPKVLQSLSEAKSIKSIKSILRQAGVSAESLPEEMLLQLSKTKSTKRIADMIHFGANYESFSSVGRLLKSPGMKFLGSFLSKALLFVEAGIGIFSYISGTSEANEVKETNLERGELLQDQVNTNAVIDTAILGVGVTLACIPGVGWVALAVGAGAIGIGMGVKERLNASYKVTESFKHNRKELFEQGQETRIALKQYAVGKQAYSYGLPGATADGHRYDSVETIYGSKPPEYISSLKTISDSTVVAVILEEYEREPLAMLKADNIHDDDIEMVADAIKEDYPTLSDSDRKQKAIDVINEAIKRVEHRKDVRIAYLKQKYGTQMLTNQAGKEEEYIDTRNMIPKGVIEKNQGINYFTREVLNESGLYADMQERGENQGNEAQAGTEESQNIQSDKRFTDHTSIEARRKTANETIAKSDRGYFAKIDKLYKENPEAFAQMGSATNLFMVWAGKDATEESAGNIKKQNTHYAMIQDYIMWKGLEDDFNISNYGTAKGYLDVDSTDWYQIEQFLENGDFRSSVIPIEDFQANTSLIESYTDEELESQLEVSKYTLQNILYEYITQVLGMQINNTMDEIKNTLREDNSTGGYLADNNGIYRDTSDQVFKIRNASRSGYDISFGNTDTIENINILLDHINKNVADIIDLPNGDIYIATEMMTKLKEIIHRNLRFRNNRETIVNEVYEYIKSQTEGKDGVIELPRYMIHQLTRAGCPNVAGYAYRYDNGNIVLYGAGGKSRSYSKIELLAGINESRQHVKAMVQIEERKTDNNSVLNPGQGHDRFDGGK